jgi:hypothetical protein
VILVAEKLGIGLSTGRFCDICNIGMGTHPNVRFEEAKNDISLLSAVTKDICDKCYNEIKPKTTDRIRRYNEAQKILDGDDDDYDER